MKFHCVLQASSLVPRRFPIRDECLTNLMARSLLEPTRVSLLPWTRPKRVRNRVRFLGSTGTRLSSFKLQASTCHYLPLGTNANPTLNLSMFKLMFHL
ncbi:hypothetical protein BC629DRAFT_1509313 [Irpex lacteus]|nr:hypothetical protein BC629DRAFT_1509313 [Irpex lacteus]